ncbi:hypothetical protein OG698_17835 [Streptomyces sp. NBC_01003]|uniref:hypothetical protein n=1 Tax=Streptomyces sp. NBC_01003 TaxID=2903714 RepID=UPI00386F9D5B|nr:hypothetical protein OG698_17835 [Streptomyces sp. NBC_01003]
MEIARLVIDILKIAIWPMTLISLVLLFRNPIRSALEQRDVRFEALGMNVEITRQAESATEALDTSSGFTAETLSSEARATEPDALPKDRLGSAGRRALEGFPEVPYMQISMSNPARDLLPMWNEINKSVRSVQDSFELGWESNWGNSMSHVTGNLNWTELGLAWTRVKEAVKLFAHPIESNTGPWRLTESRPPIADSVAKMLLNSMRALYDRLLSEVQRLSAIDIAPTELLNQDHGPTIPLPSTAADSEEPAVP